MSLKKPIIMNNGKVCDFLDNKCIIYENKYFKKLNEIKIEKINKIKSIIELDNKDLIFLTEKEDEKDELLIYRLKNNNYNLIQKIIEFDDISDNIIPKDESYYLYWHKKLSGNRFITISSYGFRIYSLNNKNLYSFVLMEKMKYVDKIYEIKNNKILFCFTDYVGNPVGDCEFPPVLNIQIKDLYKKESLSKLTDSNLNNIIFKYTIQERLEFSDGILLKNKYFIILIDYYLLILDILNITIIKNYIFLINKEKNLYYETGFNIIKWKSSKDNEFLLIKNGNIFLFELDENILENRTIIYLKIIGFYNLNYDLNLKSDENNKLNIIEKEKEEKEEDRKKDNIFYF